MSNHIDTAFTELVTAIVDKRLDERMAKDSEPALPEGYEWLNDEGCWQLYIKNDYQGLASTAIGKWLVRGEGEYRNSDGTLEGAKAALLAYAIEQAKPKEIEIPAGWSWTNGGGSYATLYYNSALNGYGVARNYRWWSMLTGEHLNQCDLDVNRRALANEAMSVYRAAQEANK